MRKEFLHACTYSSHTTAFTLLGNLNVFWK
jgi:hypothetical protein